MRAGLVGMVLGVTVFAVSVWFGWGFLFSMTFGLLLWFWGVGIGLWCANRWHQATESRSRNS